MLDLFKNKKTTPQRLLKYGFAPLGDDYRYAARLLNGQFEITVTISNLAQVVATLTDTSSDEEYVLHVVPESSGAFVSGVREEYGKILSDIAEKAFEPDVFKSSQARTVIEYVRSEYGDELEYLWEKFPSNAVWRRQENGKWYGALVVIPKTKLGMDDSALCDVINLRANPEMVSGIIDNMRYFPAYHMNKTYWLSLCLDGSLSLKELYQRIGCSYALAAKK